MKNKHLLQIFIVLLWIVAIWKTTEIAQAADCAKFYSIDGIDNIVVNADDPVSDDIEGYKGYRGYCLYETDMRDIEYTVEVSRGAIVTYQIGKNKPQELAHEESYGLSDFYTFKMPVTDQVNKITAQLGDNKTVLTLRSQYKKEVVKAVKPKYCVEPGFDYGRIVADGLYYIDFFPLNYYNTDKDIYCDNCFKGKEMQSWNRSREYVSLLDGSSDEVKMAWKWLFAHLIKNGYTVKVMPAYEKKQRFYDDFDDEHMIEQTEIERLYDGLYGKVQGITFEEYKRDDWGSHYRMLYSKDITVSWLDVKVKEAKVRIPAQKPAPTVKVDAVKGTLTTKSNQEISVRSNAKEGEAYSEWTTAGAKMKLGDITCNNGILSGASIRIRTKATGKTIASRYTTIEIPAQTQLQPDGFTMTGTTTDAAIKIADFDKVKNPYEYTTSAPSDSTKWTPVKNGEIKFTAKKPFQGTIYIRQKGVNENTKKGLTLKLPSSYVTVKLDGTTLKWSIE